VKAYRDALCDINGLMWPSSWEQQREDGNLDLLDWLRCIFGFQIDSVKNQREHLILLLANIHARLKPKPEPFYKLDARALDELMERLFSNYKLWCSFLGKKHNLILDGDERRTPKEKLLYMGLYFLIWGEAANVRFLPECIAYVFHQMAVTLHCRFDRSYPFEDSVNPEGILRTVITPLYLAIAKESERSKDGTSSLSSWSNYDDLNEYFWSPGCFSLSWPLPSSEAHLFKSMHREAKSRGTSSFVERRTFLNIFRSFDRLWSIYILALQAMVTVAWRGNTEPDTLYYVSSIFITQALLSLLQSILDLCFNYPPFQRMNFMKLFRRYLKIVVNACWLFVLLLSYIHVIMFPRKYMAWCPPLRSIPALYMTAVAVYLLPNILAAALFIFPMLQTDIENSDRLIMRFFLWWSQPRVYVGRGMRESYCQILKYTIFWLLLLFSKMAFSYHFQIVKLVKATKDIFNVRQVQYAWHEIFPQDSHNIGAVISLWAPVILVYFMDTQIWYAIFSTLCGGLVGAVDRLGEIRNQAMVRSRFQSLPGAFKANLLPSDVPRKRGISLAKNYPEVHASESAKFAQLWNEECLLLIPYKFPLHGILIQWPLFLLAGKVQMAMKFAAESHRNNVDLWESICDDKLMKCAVIESFEILKDILYSLVVGVLGKRVVKAVIAEVEGGISGNTLLANFRMVHLQAVCKKLVELLKILKESNYEKTDVVQILRDMFKIVTCDMMVGEMIELAASVPKYRNEPFFATDIESFTKFASPERLDRIKRLELLLTVKESEADIPMNLEARRRIAFFTNSLFMEMPRAPHVCEMLSFSVLTPYYKEETVYSKENIEMKNEDGVSMLYYLRTIFPDEWNNFMERLQCKKLKDVLGNEANILPLCHWASLRGQTLFRTVRGMMYYKRALQLQAFFDMSSDHEIGVGYNSVSIPSKLEAVAEMKFSYVAACQIYGSQKQNNDRHATDILDMMVKNPSLRVAYIDEVEETKGGITEKVYYSVLVKAVDNRDQEIYRIKLPGPVKLGEGKPENQNHAIIFTRGEALQTIDMNQDNYLEEALKMRNLLQEFDEDHGVRPPTILGVREHIFTGSISSLAWFMSNQETSFVTIGQRVLARPLKVRFHYGHPDVFDKIFHITRGGISKASRGINLSEDIFAGYNSTLRRGNVTHHEYIQVGKGRDVGFNQISLFEAKVACGNGEQILSRDIYRLGRRFDLFRMMSCYYTTVGFYFSSMMIVVIIYVFLYGKLYLSLSGLETSIINYARSSKNFSLQDAMASEALIQMGFFTVLPMFMEIGLERGFRKALAQLIIMQLLLGPVFFTFSLGTKAHYFGRTILHGGAKYMATGRGFVVRHETFSENYRMYSRSHFVKAVELILLLAVYGIYGSPNSYLFFTMSIWFLVICWLFGPFLFNPLGFEWTKIVEDWQEWTKWINRQWFGGSLATECWSSWWDEEQGHISSWILECVLSLRFFLYQYGVVYHLHITSGEKNIRVYGLSWLVVIVVMTLLKIESFGKKLFGSDFQLMFRLLKWLLCIVFVVTVAFLSLFMNLTIGDAFAGFIAFLPTGWALLQISRVFRPTMEVLGLWSITRSLARKYDYIIGLLILAPVAILSWFPCVSVFQTRLLFNQAFSRGLEISRILVGGKKDT
ncbi:hypothetical protein MKW92_000964, partial [Papaver armeniacum]